MELELARYFKAVFRWWWLILLSTIIAAVGSYYASLQQPRIYQTTTTLMVGQVFRQADPTGSDFSTTEQLAESYAQIAVRRPILEAAVDGLGLPIDWRALRGRVRVVPIPRTQLLAITVQDNSPERAVAIADEIAYQLILQSPSSPENQARQERSRFVQSELDALERRIEVARTRIGELETELATALSASQIRDLETEIENLESLINDWQRNYSDLLSFLEGGNSPNYLTIIEPAQLETTPISPDVQMNVLLAAAVGFVLAVAAAFLIEFIDDTIKTPDEMSTLLDVTSLGSISNISGRAYQDKLITSHNPFSVLAEAYRGVRTNIHFIAVDQPPKSILITSPNPGEGKSITTANLAVTMAQAFFKTIVVDTDMRQPSLHQIFELPNKQGITDLIRSPELEIEECLYDSGVDNLQVLTSGSLPPNPAEILGSQRMAELLQRLEEMADVIIFDSPPVMAVTDASVLSSQVDGVILVIKAKRTRRSMAREAAQRLQQVGANILGGVLNQVPSRGGQYYQGYSAYSHSSQVADAGSSRQRWWQRVKGPSKSYVNRSAERKTEI